MIIIHNIASFRVSSMTRNKIAKIIFSNWMNLNFIMFFPFLSVFYFFFLLLMWKIKEIEFGKVLHLYIFFVHLLHFPKTFKNLFLYLANSSLFVYFLGFPCWLFAIRQTFVRILFPQQSLECLNFKCSQFMQGFLSGGLWVFIISF